MSASATSTTQVIPHVGIVTVAINQDSVNQLLEGVQGIEAAALGVNESTGIEAIQTVTNK